MIRVRLERRQFSNPPDDEWFDELLRRINEGLDQVPLIPVKGVVSLDFGDVIDDHTITVRFPNVSAPGSVIIEWSEEPVENFKWRGIGDGRVKVDVRTAGTVRLRAER